MRNYKEYEGGYAKSTEVDALLAAKRAKRITKGELRMFFALLEEEESGGKVSVDFLLNGERPKRRMTSGEQEIARELLSAAISDFSSETELTTKIPRKFSRAAARGILDASVMVAALFYFRSRKPQRRRRKLVVRGERYASFTYERAKEVTGIARGTLCRAFKVLRKMKVIAVAWRPMQQIKRFGMLFVDGSALNLYCRKGERYRGSNPYKRLQKTKTEPSEKVNANYKTLPKNSFNSFSSKSGGRVGVIEAFAAKFCPNHQLLYST